MDIEIFHRLQRMRATENFRDLCATTQFLRPQLIQPLFVVNGLENDEEIPGLRGSFRHGPDSVYKQIEADIEAGVSSFLMFYVPSQKEEEEFDIEFASENLAGIKSRFGNAANLWVDTCLCSFTTHGHCCVFDDNEPDHEATILALTQLSLAYAQGGADGIAPSDMMDGRVAGIRATLDNSGYDMVPIMSYSTKFASSFYGPFRAAADSAPAFGDRRTYQIDVRNQQDAIASSKRCAEEGADLLMVKPGMPSADLIRDIHRDTGLPVGAYQVSGEYAGMALLAKEGLADFDKILLESWHILKRAGAQFIISYGARYGKQLGI
jgi:porphobilinogen synthase